MKVRIEFDASNAAFADNALEVRDILLVASPLIADAVDAREQKDGLLHDSNGNRVGQWRVRSR